MQLFSKCKQCKAEMEIPNTSVNTRPDLSNQMGSDEFSHRCMECSHVNKLHVNDVKATPSTIKILIGLAIAAFLILLFLIFLWNSGLLLVSTLFFTIPALIFQSEQNKVRAFNKYLVRR